MLAYSPGYTRKKAKLSETYMAINGIKLKVLLSTDCNKDTQAFKLPIS